MWKEKEVQKESSLTSTACNRQQSGEHEGIFGVSLSPPHTHRRTLNHPLRQKTLLFCLPVSSPPERKIQIWTPIIDNRSCATCHIARFGLSACLGTNAALKMWPKAGICTAPSPQAKKTVTDWMAAGITECFKCRLSLTTKFLSLSLPPLSLSPSQRVRAWATGSKAVNQTTGSLTNHTAAAGWCNHSHTDTG